MRRIKEWDGCSYGKTTPSLQAYPQNYNKNEEVFVFFSFDGFPREEGK